MKTQRSAEEIIAALGSRRSKAPVCWIACYEERPLQGAPPNSAAPHLLVFSSVGLYDQFIAGRERFFVREPISAVPVDSPGTLKELASAPARDSRYAAPPNGILLNFSYPHGVTDAALSPETVAQIDVDGLAVALGMARPATSRPRVLGPAIAQSQVARSAQERSRPYQRSGVTPLVWAVAGILLVAVVVGIWFMARRSGGGEGVPGVDKPLKVQDGSIQVTDVERTDSFSVGGQTARARSGYELLLIGVDVQGVVPLAGVDDGIYALINGEWKLTDATRGLYEPVGLVGGRLVFEVEKPAQGLWLGVGDELNIPLDGFLGRTDAD
jgi:hypothetical protein